MSNRNEDSKTKGIPLKVLILEDRPADAELMLHELRVAGYDPSWKRVETEEDFREHLEPSLEIIIADYNLPQFTGLQAIEILTETDLDIPLIVVTGVIEETALECLKRGAVDYLLKDRMGRLGPAVIKALEERNIREDNKLAAEALRASEQRYRGVAETALTGLTIVDPEGHFTYTNPAFSEMVGYTSKELLGMSLSQIVEPEEFTTIRTHEGYRKQGRHSQYETILKRKDGESRVVIVSASPLTSNDGKHEGSQAVITDITERVKAEEKFKIIFESAPDPYYLSDLKGKFLDGNKAAERLTGYLKEELIGKSFLNLDLLPKSQLLKAAGLIAKNVLGQSTGPDEFTINSKDGGEVEVEITTHPVEIEGNTLVLGIARDISERVQVEEQLKLQSLALESAANAILITDAEGNIQWVNPAFSKLTGYPLEEALGNNPRILKSDLYDDKFYKNLWDTISAGEIWHGEITNKHKDGELYTEEMTIAPLVSEENEITNYIAIKQDITERVRAENALGESEEKLRLMIDNSPIGFNATDLKGNFLDVNPAMCLMVGYSKNELLAKHFNQISHPDDKEKSKEEYQKLVEGKIEYFDLEKRYIHKNGKSIHVLIRAQLARNYEGEPLFEFALIEDITERKQAEEKIQHLNLILRTIRSINQLIVEEKNKQALIQKVCKILTDNRGYKNAWIVLLSEKGEYLDSAESGLGKKFTPLKKMLEKGELPICGSNALKKQDTIIVDDPSIECSDCPLSTDYDGRSGFSIRLGYGNEIYGTLTVSIPGYLMETEEEQDLFREIGGDIGFALHNIEAEKKSEKAEAQLKLQSLALESAANAILITDAEGSIQWANQAFSTLTGYSLEEAIGNNPRILKSGQQDDKFYKNLWDTISKGEVWQGEITNKRNDGELYTEEMTIAPLLSKENEISNYIAIKQDITERVRAKEEIQQRTEDLTLINSINTAVNRGENLPEIIQLLTEESKRVFHSQNTTVYLFSEDKNYLEMKNLSLPPATVKQIEKLIGTRIPDIRIPVKEGSLTQELLQVAGPRLINDTETIQEWILEFIHAIDLSEKSQLVIQKLISQIYKILGIQSLIIVPMISAGETIGLMDFSRREPFSEGDAKRVAGVVGQVTAAITSLRAKKEKARSQRLLLTLSQAAPAVQRAGNAEEIYKSIGGQAAKVGFDVSVFTLSDDKKQLIVSYYGIKSDLVRTVEKLTNLSAEGYSFPLKKGGYFHKIITNGDAVYNQLDIKPIEEILPRPLRPLANKVLDLFKNQQSIFAPLTDHGEVYGLLSFSGTDLHESDVPAIKTFANQAAIALEKTRLFNETQELAAFNENIVQSMSEGIVLEDAEGIFTFVNPAAASILGYTTEELVGMHRMEIIPPDQKPLVLEVEGRRKRGQADQYELDLVCKDGRRVSSLVSGNPRVDKEGHFIGTMAVFTDITHIKRAEEKISRFSRIFEDSLNEIYLFETDTLKFTQVNSAGQNNLGYTMEELSQLTPLDIKPEITAQAFEYLIAPLRKNETDRVVFETVHQRKDGSLYHVEVYLQLLRYEDKALFAAIIMDITDRYNAEIESKRYIRRLDALLNIDQAIMGSFDLQVTLNVILEHILTQLAIDAVAVLSYHSDLQTLSFTQGRGFQTPALQYTDLRLGEGYAGEVGLRREHLFIPDLSKDEGKFQESPLFSQEGFVSYYGIPLLVKGKLVGVLEIFNRSVLDPADEWVNYLRLLAGQVAIAIDNISLFNELQRSNVDLTLSYDATIEGWARALELKDMETEGHSRRVVELTMGLARRMGIGGEKLAHVRRGALLHDIGKMGIPDSILQKPGKLTDDEWQIMRQHPVYAYEWLSRIQYLQPAMEIPYAHHERWDGTGYPRGLSGEQIPLAARIFAIVDVWDALRSDRSYRKAWSKNKTLAHIKEQSGKHFDPRVVKEFLLMIDSA